VDDSQPREHWFQPLAGAVILNGNMTGKIFLHGAKIVVMGNEQKKFRHGGKFSFGGYKTSSSAWKLSCCGTHSIGQDLPTPFISTYIGKVDFILPCFM
jgi:hypothetical protein